MQNVESFSSLTSMLVAQADLFNSALILNVVVVVVLFAIIFIMISHEYIGDSTYKVLHTIIP